MFSLSFPRTASRVARASFTRSFGASTARMSDALFVHRDSPENNAEIPFKFSTENEEKVKTILAKYPPQYKKAGVIPLLDLAQRQNDNFTSLSVMNEVAKILEIPPMRVYEVATFYTMFNRTKLGKNFIQLCTTTPCQLGGCGSTVIQKALEEKLGIKAGGTTPDEKFTLVEVECLGACSNAPMMQIGDDFFEDLTPETAIKIIEALERGETPKAGPQSGRHTSENSAGLTTLLEKPYGPGEHCTPEFS